jgi:methionyl-tRNA synthetase
MVDARKPWEIAKDAARTDELQTVLISLLECVRVATLLMLPIMPAKAAAVASGLFPSLTQTQWMIPDAYDPSVLVGQALGEGAGILFPRL